MRKNRNKRSKTRILSLIIGMSLVLTGCGAETEDIPELLEPVSTNESYRPVEYGDIGKNIIKIGSVVPNDYCHFYTTSVNIESIDVSIGDYVEAGDVIATASQESADSSLEEAQAQLDNQIATHDINQKIYEENQSKLSWLIKAYEEAGDTETADAYKLEKATNAENNRYDNLLYEHQIADTREEIEEKQEISDNNTMVARHSGYVTYVKDISTSYQVEASENVVIISDYDDAYIEISDEEVSTKGYSSYNMMYTIIDGTRYDITEYKYTNEELATAQSNKTYPCVRFKLADASGSLLTVGNLAPLYFSASDVSNVLIIGNDSLQEEGENYFVYVKNESGEKERRDIVIGAYDDNYTEVVSGLSEGEMVCYTSDVMVPSEYSEYEVALGDLRVTVSADEQTLKPISYKTYEAPVSGECTLINVNKGDAVNEGDLLFTIDSGGGSAELLQMENEIKSAVNDYNDSLASYNDEITSISNEIKEYQNGTKQEGYTTDTATPSDAEAETEEGGTGDNTLYMTKRLNCDLNIAKYNKELLTLNYNSQMDSLNSSYEELKENNDGSGNVSVYAESSGTVEEIYYVTGNNVEAGAYMISIGSDSDMKIAVTVDEGDGMLINQRITFVSNEDESVKITGRCIGSNINSSKVYITTINDKVYITSTTAYGLQCYYVEVDDDSYYDAPESYKAAYDTMTLENVITVPSSLIYTETNKTNGKVYNYVWKVYDGELIKQYVQIDETLKDVSNTCILSGVSEGDILARESGGQ